MAALSSEYLDEVAEVMNSSRTKGIERRSNVLRRRREEFSHDFTSLPDL